MVGLFCVRLIIAGEWYVFSDERFFLIVQHFFHCLPPASWNCKPGSVGHYHYLWVFGAARYHMPQVDDCVSANRYKTITKFFFDCLQAYGKGQAFLRVGKKNFRCVTFALDAYNPLPCKMMGFGLVVQNQKLAFLTAVIHNFKIAKRLIIRFKKKGVVAVKSSSSSFTSWVAFYINPQNRLRR